jgi:hypothetical protein
MVMMTEETTADEKTTVAIPEHLNGAVAWLLSIDPRAHTHITDDIETRERWIGDYGAKAVYPLGIINEDRKPVGWRYRLKGLSAWHYYDNEVFDLPSPEAYERDAVFLR